MAGSKKISELTEQTDPNSADQVAIEDDGLSATRRVSLANLIKGLFELQMAENVGIYFQESLSADAKWSGIVIDGVLGDTIAYGDLLYLNEADDRWELADADAEATSGDVWLTVALEAGSDGDTKKLLVLGFIREDDWDFTNGGHALFVSTTAGDFTGTAPSATGDIVRVAGYQTADPNVVFFNPSKSWIELA